MLTSSFPTKAEFHLQLACSFFLRTFVTRSGVTVGYKFTRCRLVSPTPLDNIARLTYNYATAHGRFITTSIAPELGWAAEGVKGTFSQFLKWVKAVRSRQTDDPHPLLTTTTSHPHTQHPLLGMVNVRSLKEAESTLISLLQINQTGCLILFLRFTLSGKEKKEGKKRRKGLKRYLWIRKRFPGASKNQRAWQRLWEWHMQTWSSVITWRSFPCFYQRASF